MLLINIDTLNELLRIKKPGPSALIVGKLFCAIIHLTRSPQSTFQSVEADCSGWEDVQSFISANASKII